MKRFLILLLLPLCIHLNAQSIAGYWYGVASVSTGASSNNYMVELILRQTTRGVKGILNYYFRNTYRSVQINGDYSPSTRNLSLYDIAVPYYGSTSDLEVDCKMDFVATERMAKAGSNLVGRFIGKENYKYTCPDIVFDLKLNKDAGNQDSILTALRNFKETNQLWRPTATDTLVAAVVQQKKVQNIVVDNEFKQRENVVQRDLFVASDSIKVDFYDNGEVDGDSISVFFNNQLLGANLRLSTRAIHMDLVLDSTKEVNELSMFANNLGSIPPNTALMLVYDGKKRYEVNLSSNLSQNATVHLRRKPLSKGGE